MTNGQVEDGRRERSVRARSVAWPIIGRLGRLDPGSNPGAPTSMRSAIQSVSNHPCNWKSSKSGRGQHASYHGHQRRPTCNVGGQSGAQRDAAGTRNKRAERSSVMLSNEHGADAEEKTDRTDAGGFLPVNWTNGMRGHPQPVPRPADEAVIDVTVS